MNSSAYVGLDVHKSSTSPSPTTAPAETTGRSTSGAFPTTSHAPRRRSSRSARPNAVRVCNEAGPTGYGLCRELRERGYDCEVVEPSKTPQRRGARVKTDRRDARLLAEFLQSGHLAIVRVPTPEEEALRDLIRAFKAFKGIKALITATIVPEVGDLRRFPTAKPFASFLGLTPLRASER